jgi:methyltransferase (TIGR00027 family)
VRADEPSRTARGVAVARARVDRIPWPTGDAEADDRLTSEVIGDWAPAVSARPSPDAIGLVAWIELRTRFFDRVVTDALSAGIDQIVSLGAGYDGRAVRYRTPGVRFFEVDHPATQATKRRRRGRAAAPGVVFAPADLTVDDLGAVLRAAVRVDRSSTRSSPRSRK